MIYPVSSLKDSHELWQKANARQNARLYHERETLKAAQDSHLREDMNPTYTLLDIEEYFQKHGRGTHLLEYEFTPDPGGPTEYIRNGTSLTSRYWLWTHKLTNVIVKRFASSSGKSFDSGRLSKALACITKKQHPLAYERAQKILLLNDPTRDHSVDKLSPMIAIERVDVFRQQVSRITLL